MSVIGIDPGSVSAAYGVLDIAGRVVDVGDVPVVDRMVDAAAFSRLLEGFGHLDDAVIEQVSAMPKQGVSSSFRFGMGCGMLRGVLAARGIPLVQVTPTQWKKHFALNNDGEKSRALALRRWPSCRALSRKKDHGRAEALLLALWHLETRK
jgi:crossover junction endodeoxyribonuclease RuvC